MRCTEIEDLERFVAERLEPETSHAVRAHLSSCDPCRLQADRISENLRMQERLRRSFTAEGERAAVPVAPAAFGEFQVIRELGRGGMGAVYLAEQRTPRRRVALKVLHPGAASPALIRRFEHEANLLGRLRHPGIAQVFEAGIAEVSGPGGTSEQWPYFAMEHVPGLRLDHYVAQRELDAGEKLVLLATICDAVHYAHVQGVVHRDLKPANILVEEEATAAGSDATRRGPVGRPKVLDFGVARAVGSEVPSMTMGTTPGELIGTLPFMSPEQVAGDPSKVDARSDVYSLGVIGFHLLTGKLPYADEDRSVPEWARVIRDDEPTRLSSFSTRFRGDLETIFGKALEKNPEQRYQSASELAADLRRYLRDEPIVARAPSTVYQLRKLVARHRAIATLTAAAFALTLAYGVTMSLLFARARDAERRASAEAETAKEVTSFLSGLFKSSDPGEARGEDLTAREILDRGAERVRTELRDRPVVQGAVLHRIGTVYRELGLHEESRTLLEEALSVRREALGERHVEVANTLNNLGLVHLDLGEYEEAAGRLREALALKQDLLGNRDLDVAVTRDNLAVVHYWMGDLAAAESLYTRSLGTMQEVLGDEHATLATTLNNVAMLKFQRGDFEGAEAMSRRSLAMRRKLLGEPHPEVANGLNNLAFLLKRQEKYDEAGALYREALEMNRALVGEDHPSVALNLGNLAAALAEQGRMEEAEALHREALAVYRKSFDEDHPDVATTQNNLAGLLLETGRVSEADALYRKVLAALRGRLGEEHPRVAVVLSSLGRVASAQGRADEALRLHGDALERMRRAVGDRHPRVAVILFDLGSIHTEQDDPAAAEPLLREALDIRLETLPEGHSQLFESKLALGRALTGMNRCPAAEPLLVEALAGIEERDPADEVLLRDALGALADHYRACDQPERAQTYLARLEGGP